MAARCGEPRKGNRLGRPRDRHHGRPELNGRGHRQRSDPGADGQQPEEVPIALAEHEPAADGELPEREEHEEGPAVHGVVANQQRESRPDRERHVRQEQAGGRRRQVVTTAAERLTTSGNDIQQPVESNAGEAREDSRAAVDPGRHLRRRQNERDRGQPRPRSPEGDPCRADQHGGDEEERQEIGLRAHDRRRHEHGDEPEERHDLRVEPDRDCRGRKCARERAGQADLGGHEPVQRRRGEQAQRDDRQADRRQDEPEQAIAATEEHRARGHDRGAGHEADEDPDVRADPAPTEGEAEEEDRAEDQRESADPGKGSTLQPCLDLAEGPRQVGHRDDRPTRNRRRALRLRVTGPLSGCRRGRSDGCVRAVGCPDRRSGPRHIRGGRPDLGSPRRRRTPGENPVGGCRCIDRLEWRGRCLCGRRRRHVRWSSGRGSTAVQAHHLLDSAQSSLEGRDVLLELAFSLRGVVGAHHQGSFIPQVQPDVTTRTGRHHPISGRRLAQ